MPICYVVPGIAGSELFYRVLGIRKKLWVAEDELLLGNVGKLRLDAAGTGPGSPDGEQCEPGEPLNDYYGEVKRSLTTQLGPHGYDVRTFGYDWRMAIIGQGEILADRIRSEVAIGDPCAIAAHSQGGLVARAAWSSLGMSGQTGLVRRIVTLGTPHQGSYATVALLSADDEIATQLSLASQIGSIVIGPVGPFYSGRQWSTKQLAALAATWPGLYDMLPLLGGSEAAFDPHREWLFAADHWPADRHVSQDHLDTARNVTGPWLRSAASIPPEWVLTTVSGRGLPTYYALETPSDLGDVGALNITGLGDGRVTTGSAEVPQSVRYSIAARHSDEPNQVSESGQLAGWILEVRNPPAPPPPGPPPPPVEELAGPLVPGIAGPPIPRALQMIVGG